MIYVSHCIQQKDGRGDEEQWCACVFFSVPFVLACDQWIEIGFEKVMEQNPD